MRVTVNVNTDLLYWAIERSGKDSDVLSSRFPKLEKWLSRDDQPTLKQLEEFAKATFTPFGKFFLDSPPEDRLPIADFRTLPKAHSKKPSPHLLETIYICQRRQEWYREYCLTEGYEPLGFVESASINDSPQNIAQKIRDDFSLGLTKKHTDRKFSKRRDSIDEQRVLVMCSGIVGSNTRRSLDINEFRGFALTDNYAPIIFVNTKDSDAAKNFTLIHELAHIYLGESGVSNLGNKDEHRIERWCNQVAAEVLVPLDDFKEQFNAYGGNESDRMVFLSKRYMVSSLVVLNRMKDASFIDEHTFWELYRTEEQEILARLKERKKGSGAMGNFYYTKPVAISKSFGKALTHSALEGTTLYLEAMQMLGVKKISTFNRLAEKLYLDEG